MSTLFATEIIALIAGACPIVRKTIKKKLDARSGSRA